MAAVIAAVLAVGGEGDPNKEADQSCLSALRGFLADRAIPPCKIRTSSWDVAGDALSVQLAFGSQQGEAVIRRKNARVSFFTAPAPGSFPDGAVSLDRARQTALEFARRQCSPVWRCGDHVIVIGPSAPDQEGILEFTVQAMAGEMWLPDACLVGVRAYDGKIGSFVGALAEAEYRVPPVRVSRVTAEQAALEAARRSGSGRQVEVAWSQLHLIEDTAAAVWRVTVAFGPPSDRQPGAEVSIDASTGNVGGSIDIPVTLDARRRAASLREAEKAGGTREDSRNQIDERHPYWRSNDEIVYEGSRSLPGLPLWAGPVKAVYLARVGDRKLRCVLGSIRHDFIEPSVAGDVLSATYHPDAGLLLDLRSGRWRFVGNDAHPAFDTNLSRDSRRVAFVGNTRSGTALYQSRVQCDGGEWQVGPWCRITLGGGEVRCPRYSVDGNSIFFIGTTHGRKVPALGLFHLDASLPPRTTDSLDPLVMGLRSPIAFTPFPDGRRLLVWEETGLHIVDAESGSVQQFRLPALPDPDDRNSAELEPREVTLSPDGKHVAFSASRSGATSERGVGTYIYVCGLDGSGLERVTPLEDEPVEPYVFPSTAKTGMEVAREIDVHRKKSDALAPSESSAR